VRRRYMTDCWPGREQKCLSMRRFLTPYMTVNWHREFAVNFATFLKVCRDFFTFAPWFLYTPKDCQALLKGKYCPRVAPMTSADSRLTKWRHKANAISWIYRPGQIRFKQNIMHKRNTQNPRVTLSFWPMTLTSSTESCRSNCSCKILSI